MVEQGVSDDYENGTKALFGQNLEQIFSQSRKKCIQIHCIRSAQELSQLLKIIIEPTGTLRADADEPLKA